MLHKRQQGMRRVHLIKEIEATIKRGPKSKSRFTPANTLGSLEQGEPVQAVLLSPQRCWQPSNSPGLAFRACAWRFDPSPCWACGPDCIHKTARAGSILGARCVLLPLSALKKRKKEKKKKEKTQSKHYLLLITCKVGLLPLPQFLRALK